MNTDNKTSIAHSGGQSVSIASVMLKPAALRVEDAARHAGISRSKLYGLLKSGEVASLLVGGRRLVRRETLEAFLLQQEQLAKGA